MIEVGQVEALFRYPIKSMRGERLDHANVGWHGIDGDRRLAVCRLRHERSGFPWLSASQLPALLTFTPVWRDEGADGRVPTHVRSPEGKEFSVFGAELAAEIERRHRAPVQMMHVRDGIFDDASLSVIAAETIEEIGRCAGRALDVRRFRPNIVVRLAQPTAFQEDSWVGGVLMFGGASEGPAISVTTCDVRCGMVNLDPNTGQSAPEVLKSIVRANQNNAGVYATVIRTGRLAIGQTVRFQEYGGGERS